MQIVEKRSKNTSKGWRYRSEKGTALIPSIRDSSPQRPDAIAGTLLSSRSRKRLRDCNSVSKTFRWPSLPLGRSCRIFSGGRRRKCAYNQPRHRTTYQPAKRRSYRGWKPNVRQTVSHWDTRHRVSKIDQISRDLLEILRRHRRNDIFSYWPIDWSVNNGAG